MSAHSLREEHHALASTPLTQLIISGRRIGLLASALGAPHVGLVGPDPGARSVGPPRPDQRHRGAGAVAKTPPCAAVLSALGPQCAFVWFLNNLRLKLDRKLHVVWDNLGAHRKAENFFAATACRWVRFHRLPPYSPELNPVEHVWSTGKWGCLANDPPDDVRQLRTGLEAELSRQSREQQRLRAHFRWAGLDLS